jgi:hypothetical protein
VTIAGEQPREFSVGRVTAEQVIEILNGARTTPLPGLKIRPTSHPSQQPTSR